MPLPHKRLLIIIISNYELVLSNILPINPRKDMCSSLSIRHYCSFVAMRKWKQGNVAYCCKIILYITSQFMKDKIWLRQTKPSRGATRCCWQSTTRPAWLTTTPSRSVSPAVSHPVSQSVHGPIRCQDPAAVHVRTKENPCGRGEMSLPAG